LEIKDGWMEEQREKDKGERMKEWKRRSWGRCEVVKMIRVKA